MREMPGFSQLERKERSASITTATTPRGGWAAGGAIVDPE